MKGSIRTVGLLLVLLAGAAHAEDALQEVAVPADGAMFSAGAPGSFLLARNDVILAQAETGASNAAQNVASATPGRPQFKEPIFSLNKTHEYLGIATLVAAGLTMFSAPEGCETNCANYQPPVNGTHAKLGKATRALALSAVVTGIAAHWDDIHPFEDGLSDPDTQHWLLAGAGALVLANAVSKAPAQSHAGQAELGALAMLVAVKLVW